MRWIEKLSNLFKLIFTFIADIDDKYKFIISLVCMIVTIFAFLLKLKIGGVL